MYGFNPKDNILMQKTGRTKKKEQPPPYLYAIYDAQPAGAIVTMLTVA